MFLNAKRNSIFVFLVILILTGSIFMGYKVGEVAGKEIINTHDVLQTFEIEGITFKPETSIYPKEYMVEDTEPIIYKDSQGNLLFIYTYGSFVERRENFRENMMRDQFSFTLKDKTFFSKLYNVKNLELVYAIAYPSIENTQAVINKLRKVDQVIFTDLNAGEEIVFTGESPSWEAKVSLRYYEHWWTDSKNKLQYESYHTHAPTLTYKGQIPEQAIPMEYSFSTSTSESKGTQEVTPEMLTRVIQLGTGGGNGGRPRVDDTYKVKITLDGKTEEFELKAKSDGS
ncbi:MAG: hypothetical protein APF81_11720 [Desulfosporosinus sp. BRH_c37]|nr:MAG: hypothetical protein APF81_11720 [Desulfosporosinus sp. BRH_c37]